MSDIDETESKDESGGKKPLSLKRPGRLELRKTVDAGQVRQSFSHGRSKAVTVEVKRKRTFKPGQGDAMTKVKAAARATAEAAISAPVAAPAPEPAADDGDHQPIVLKTLTAEEKVTRARALESARERDKEAREQAAIDARVRAEDEARMEAERSAAEVRVKEEDERKRVEEEARQKAEEEASRRLAPEDVEAAPDQAPSRRHQCRECARTRFVLR